MRDMRWIPGMEDDMYGNHMPKEAPMFVCEECGGLNKHLRSCSKHEECPDCGQSSDSCTCD